MFGLSRPGAAAYRQLSASTDALAASPHQLIVLLYDGAINAVSTAQAQMQQLDIEGKGLSISRAINIIGSGLAASLNTTAGGDIAHNLASLYDYLIQQLLAANLRNDAKKLDEVRTLLFEMRESWVAIAATAHPEKAAA